jgi:hypothetical protein
VRSRAPALRTTTGVTPVTLGRTGERTTTARVPIRYPNSRDGPVKAGEWSSTLTVAKSGCLQAFPYRIRRYTHCLPCRRSWVRIPSAASKGCDLQVFFGSPAGKCVCVAVYPMCTGRAGRAGRRREGSYLQVLCGRSSHRPSARGGQTGQWFESRGPRVARSGDPQCSCRRDAALSTVALAVRPTR